MQPAWGSRQLHKSRSCAKLNQALGTCRSCRNAGRRVTRRQLCSRLLSGGAVRQANSAGIFETAGRRWSLRSEAITPSATSMSPCTHQPRGASMADVRTRRLPTARDTYKDPRPALRPSPGTHSSGDAWITMGQQSKT